MKRILALLLLLLPALAASHAEDPPDWTRPFPAFRIADNLYYVGSEDLAAYLITTPEGNILINSNLASSPAQIQASIKSLGFPMNSVKILLISHAHWDHDAGTAEILKLTGAKHYVMDGDAQVVETGGRADFHYGSRPDLRYAPAKVDRVLHDGDQVRLGGAVLTAHKTAGHTRGTTTWTFDVPDAGRTLHVVIVGSPNVNPGYKLVNNRAYPQIAADYRHGFQVLESLPCDIFLGAHGGYFGMKEKYARMKAGDKDAFIDPAGYRAYVADRKQAFEREFQKQEHAVKSAPKSTSRPPAGL